MASAADAANFTQWFQGAADRNRQNRLMQQQQAQLQVENQRQNRLLQMDEATHGMRAQQFQQQQQDLQQERQLSAQERQRQAAQRSAAIANQALRLGGPDGSGEANARAFLRRALPVYQQDLSLVADDLSDLTDDNVPWAQQVQNLQQLAAFGQKDEEAYTLGPGQARFVGGRQVASVPASSEEAGFTLNPGQGRYDAQGRLIVSAPMREIPADLQGVAAGLRKEYNDASKEFVGVANSYQRIIDSASNPSAAGDLSLIFNYMKVLDPGSTVREGEFANAQNAAGVPGRIASMYNRIISGERLNEAQRADFVGRAGTLYKGQEERHKKNIRDRYAGLATRYGVDPETVIQDFSVRAQNAAAALPPVNNRGWQLMVDAQGNQAYVSPDGSQVEEVR